MEKVLLRYEAISIHEDLIFIGTYESTYILI